MIRISALLIAGALLLSAGHAAGQTTFCLGLRAGANRASTTLGDAGHRVAPGQYPANEYTAAKSALYAGQVGVVLEARRGKLAWQPALLFTQKGEKLRTMAYVSGVAGTSYFEVTSTNRTNWLALPLNVAYTLQGTHGLHVFGGAYAAVAVGGRQKGTRKSALLTFEPAVNTQEFNEPIRFGSDSPNRRFDAGFNAGLGYRQGPLLVQLGYELGLVNLRRTNGRATFPAHNFDADPAYNRVAQLTATYFWGK